MFEDNISNASSSASNGVIDIDELPSERSRSKDRFLGHSINDPASEQNAWRGNAAQLPLKITFSPTAYAKSFPAISV